MFIRKTKVKGNATAVRIVESYRDAGKPKHRIVNYIGQSKDPEEILMFEQMARTLLLKLDPQKNPSVQDKKSLAPPDVSINNLEEISRLNYGVFEIFGKVFDETGLNKLIQGTRKDNEWNDIIRSLVLLRLSDPLSKRESSQILSRDYSVKIKLEKIYRSMDRLIPFLDKAKSLILEETKRLSSGEISCLLYDVTTLYFESFTPDELRDFGFSKDCKFKETQIVLSLLTTPEGLPAGYTIFPGNTSEGKTLIDNIIEMKEKFNIKNIKLFADRAMFTKENLNKMDNFNIKYVVAAKLRSMKKDQKDQFLSDGDYGAYVFGNDICWKKEYKYEGRRLIVNYSPSRARNDKNHRDKLIERMTKKEKNGNLKVSTLITNQGTKKFVKNIKGDAQIDHDKISNDQKWDGLHGVITNDINSSAEILLEGYRKLWMIEDCFRMSKTDLKMRPVYHWKKERIEAHILICYMSLAIGKFTLNRLGSKMSLKQLSKELSKVEVSLLKDKSGKTTRLIMLPAQLNKNQKEIYKKLNVKVRITPWQV